MARVALGLPPSLHIQSLICLQSYAVAICNIFVQEFNISKEMLASSKDMVSSREFLKHPWPSFDMVMRCYVSCCFGRLWKPPWPLQLHRQIRYRAVTTTYYRGALRALLFYNSPRCTDAHAPVVKNIVIMLFVNKNDLEEQHAVSTGDTEEFAEQAHLFLLEDVIYVEEPSRIWQSEIEWIVADARPHETLSTADIQALTRAIIGSRQKMVNHQLAETAYQSSIAVSFKLHFLLSRDLVMNLMLIVADHGAAWGQAAIQGEGNVSITDMWGPRGTGWLQKGPVDSKRRHRRNYRETELLLPVYYSSSSPSSPSSLYPEFLSVLTSLPLRSCTLLLESK